MGGWGGGGARAESFERKLLFLEPSLCFFFFFLVGGGGRGLPALAGLLGLLGPGGESFERKFQFWSLTYTFLGAGPGGESLERKFLFLEPNLHVLLGPPSLGGAFWDSLGGKASEASVN